MFFNHGKKTAEKPAGRHLEHGLPLCVEEVGQGRIIYLVKYDMVFYQGFTTHKDYKKWYMS
jgi:hypothetical protein